MGDRTRDLRQTLAQLHDQLEATTVADPGLREALREALVEIREALDRPPDAAGEEARASLAERLSRLTQEFESSHPKLTETIGRLATALADLGI